MNWVFTREPHSLVRKAGKLRPPRRVTTKGYKKLYDLSKRQGGFMHVDLINGIQTFKKKVSDAALAEAWDSGDYSKTMKVIPWDDLHPALEKATSRMGESLLEAGLISMDGLPPNINKNLRWDMANPQIKHYLKERTADLVTGIQADTQQVIQNAVARRFTETASPRQIAQMIKGSIGLYPAQERTLWNYRVGMAKLGNTGAKLERMVAAQEEKLLDYRAMMIARTEARGAVNMGQLSVWNEGAKQGYFDKEEARRVWIAEGPDPCEDCLDMDGVETGLTEPWIMGDGTAVDCPPWNVHPHCYCGMELIFTPTVHEEEDV